MRNTATALACGAIIICLCSPAVAIDFSIGAKASTLGVSAEATAGLSSHFDLRAGYNWFEYSLDQKSIDDIAYEGSVKLNSIALMVDWFPFGGGIFLALGGLVNSNQADLEFGAAEPYTIGDVTYTPEDLGSITTKVEFERFAPYAGLGFGNPLGGSALGFQIEFGAVYTRAPKVEMEGTGLIAPTASQAGQIEENLSWVEFHPVLSLGLTYHF